jgi:hypothetical protein
VRAARRSDSATLIVLYYVDGTSTQVGKRVVVVEDHALDRRVVAQHVDEDLAVARFRDPMGNVRPCPPRTAPSRGVRL